MTTPKKNGNRTGLARRLRDYVRANPGKTSHEVAAAIGEGANLIARTMFKMFQHGFFSAVEVARNGSRGPSLRYSLARESLRASYNAEESAARRKERQAGYRQAETEAKRVKRQAARMAQMEAEPAPVTANVREPETYEQFVARGGKKQVIPGFEGVARGPIPVRFPQRGALA